MTEDKWWRIYLFAYLFWAPALLFPHPLFYIGLGSVSIHTGLVIYRYVFKRGRLQ